MSQFWQRGADPALDAEQQWYSRAKRTSSINHLFHSLPSRIPSLLLGSTKSAWILNLQSAVQGKEERVASFII